jgi:pimeloyl-ACP methyl ester carboxylesterase
MRAFNLTRVSMVGVSLGGWLALGYATQRPDRVERLVLLSPSGIGRQRYGLLVKALLLRPFGRWGLRRTLQLAAGATRERSPDPTIGEFALLIFRHFRPRREPVPVLDDDALRRLTAPTLLILGGRDALLDSYDTKRRVERAVPQATVRLLPDAGHVLPDQAEAVLRFLRHPRLTTH